MELRGLHELFESSTARLRVQPQNLDHLSESWNLLETMKKDVPSIEAKVRHDLPAVAGRFLRVLFLRGISDNLLNLCGLNLVTSLVLATLLPIKSFFQIFGVCRAPRTNE